MMKAPRRGLRLAKFQLLLLSFVGFLLPNVRADHRLGQTDGADAVPTRPEVVAREVPLPTQILPVNSNRRLPVWCEKAAEARSVLVESPK